MILLALKRALRQRSVAPCVLLMASGCCYSASDVEAAKICNDAELKKIIETTPSIADRDWKMRSWAEENLSSVQAKDKMELYFAAGLSQADRAKGLDEFAKSHGMARCENAHLKGPPAP